MVKLNVNYAGVPYELSLPTSLKEVDTNYLSKLVEHVTVAPEYSLIALVFRERPITIVSSVKQGKNANVSAVALMIKSGVSEDIFVPSIKTGTTLVIAPSDIAMGHHVNAPNNSLSVGFLASLINDNPELNKECMKIMTPTYFVDFKIVPNCNIHGALADSTKGKADEYLRVKGA